jgi:hypothetical protein
MRYVKPQTTAHKGGTVWNPRALPALAQATVPNTVTPIWKQVGDFFYPKSEVRYANRGYGLVAVMIKSRNTAFYSTRLRPGL